MIDWDLEAPGLNRFFRNNFGAAVRGGAHLDQELDVKEGLLELLTKLRDEVFESNSPDRMQDQDSADALFAASEVDQFILKTGNPRLHLMKAGKQDHSYGQRISTFDWEGLFNRSPWFFRAFADYFARKYDYVLIDSRTGETDTSGICTRMLPQKLVMRLTPNRQSLTGV